MRDTPTLKGIMELETLIKTHVLENPAVEAAVIAVIIFVVFKMVAMIWKTTK